MWVACGSQLLSNSARVWREIDRYHPLRSLDSDLHHTLVVRKNWQGIRKKGNRCGMQETQDDLISCSPVFQHFSISADQL